MLLGSSLRTRRSVISLFEVARRPGRDGCQSALWDCFGERISRHVKNLLPETVPQCLLKPSRPGLPRNLKEANWPIFSLSPVTVPEVFGKANSAQFPYRFFK